MNTNIIKQKIIINLKIEKVFVSLNHSTIIKILCKTGFYKKFSNFFNKYKGRKKIEGKKELNYSHSIKNLIFEEDFTLCTKANYHKQYQSFSSKKVSKYLKKNNYI